MGLAATKQKSKEECLKIIGQNIDLDNLNFLAEIAQKSGINAKLSSKKGMIKNFI